MRLVKLPTIANKYLDTIVHSLISSVHALAARYDVALYFIAGNSPVTFIPRLVGSRTILNVDGLDWKREKWPPIAKKYIQFAEYLATKLPNKFITDSTVVQHHYRDRYGVTPLYIPYGSELLPQAPGETLARFGLQPQRYILFVGRLVPENCAHHLVEAFKGLSTDMKCVIVGDAPYAENYITELRELAKQDPRVVFTGYVFGKGYHELSSNAHVFVETSCVGGTHPALLEAMAFGNCVVVHDNPENLETVGDAGLGYDGKAPVPALRSVLEKLIANPDMVADYRRKARQRAGAVYRWDDVTDSYERLFFQLCKPSVRAPLVTKTAAFSDPSFSPDGQRSHPDAKD
jgi:glycosyltransferase involved in cell wall biosynthesis